MAIEPALIFYSEEKAWSNLDNSKEMSTFWERKLLTFFCFENSSLGNKQYIAMNIAKSLKRVFVFYIDSFSITVKQLALSNKC